MVLLLLSSSLIIPVNASESGNITNPTAEPYVASSVLTVVFADLAERVPNFWANKYYWVYFSSGTDFSICIFEKDDSVVKVYKPYNYTTGWTLRKWGTTARVFYTYNRTTGNFVSSQSLTTEMTTTIDNMTIMSNIPVYTYTAIGTYIISGYNRFIPAENLPPGSAEDNTDYGWWGNLMNSLAGWIVSPLVNFWNSMGFGTWFSDLGKQFGAFIAPVAEDIGNAISSLFIPTQQNLTDFFDDFNTFFNSKLGFVWYPISWTISTFNSMLSIGEKTSFPLGTYFGGQLTIDMTTIQTKLPTLWNYMRLSLQFITSWTLVSALYQKLMAKLKGDNSSDN